MASYNNPWIYLGKPFESSDIGDYYGFVYKITNTIDSTSYIGKKFFWSMLKQKNATRRKKQESNWKNYWSSSDILKELVHEFGVNIFTREIISLHSTPGQVNYNEIKVQFQLDVLESLKEDGSRSFYNQNIASRYFVPKSLEHLHNKSEETRKKISDTLISRGISPVTRFDSPSDETRKKISNIMKNKSIFVNSNPRSTDNWTYIVENNDGVSEIKGFKNSFLKTHSEKNYTALMNWSKLQNKRSFKDHSKIKKSSLHPKFGIKIIGYVAPDGSRVDF